MITYIKDKINCKAYYNIQNIPKNKILKFIYVFIFSFTFIIYLFLKSIMIFEKLLYYLRIILGELIYYIFRTDRFMVHSYYIDQYLQVKKKCDEQLKKK